MTSLCVRSPIRTFQNGNFNWSPLMTLHFDWIWQERSALRNIEHLGTISWANALTEYLEYEIFLIKVNFGCLLCILGTLDHNLAPVITVSLKLNFLVSPAINSVITDLNSEAVGQWPWYHSAQTPGTIPKWKISSECRRCEMLHCYLEH